MFCTSLRAQTALMPTLMNNFLITASSASSVITVGNPASSKIVFMPKREEAAEAVPSASGIRAPMTVEPEPACRTVPSEAVLAP